MPWIRFEDNFPEHPKIMGLSDGAFRLHISAIAYCSRQLTDGVVPRNAVRALSGNGRTTRSSRLVTELLRLRLWTSTDAGYVVHDYLDYQPSRSEVESRRKADRERKKQDGIRSASNRSLRGIR